MKSDLVLLVTRDPELQQQWTIAALASGARRQSRTHWKSLNLVMCDARLSRVEWRQWIILLEIDSISAKRLVQMA